MKITVLVDNNTIIDRYFLGEPGVAFLVQEGDRKVLFDTGYSDIFISNAKKLGIDLNDLYYVVISHGHNDHTWGLVPLIRLYTEARSEGRKMDRPVLLAHEQAFEAKYYGDETIGSMLSAKALEEHFEMRLGREPFWITDKLVFLGEIERTNSFENRKPVGKHSSLGFMKDDYVMDDTAMAYRSSEGLVIITGCSHSGICNIIEYAKKVTGEDRIADIVGGFHLLDPDTEQLEKTKAYMRQAGVCIMHPCHCTDFKSKLALSEVAEIKEVGVGLVLEYD
jgi:7,8-dihydropterin-6-yl-methyl-4-(beta-D-ribofuranosyl)aminobenzene 5'-phosphate synthase